MNTTLIYIHIGWNDYLDGVFALTRHFNKKNKIILIGDDTNREVAIKYGFIHYQISEYEESINYHHISVNTELYEKFCFSRWFILKNFINANNVDHVLYSDSDNAVIYDFNSIVKKNACLGNKQVVVPNMFFVDSISLRKICGFYKELYSVSYEDCFSRILKSGYLVYHENNISKPLFSDMMFLRMAIEELKLEFELLPETSVTGPVYNSNINYIKTTLKDDKVFIENTNTNLLNIHFAGYAKIYVIDYLSLINFRNTGIC